MRGRLSAVFGVLTLLSLTPVCLAESPDWGAYNDVLKEFVSPGEKNGVPVNLVDYQGLSKSKPFEQVVKQIRTFNLARLQTWEERLAFYINAYNILTIQLIIDHWPVDSIRDIGNLLRGPWDQVVLTTSSTELTLDNIEHDIIRSYDEPLIHFAVNCASLSCPDLRREAYQADKLDAQLMDQFRGIFQQKGKGALIDDETLRVTKLFRWYAGDFEADGDVETFIRTRLPELEFSDIKPNLDYDWSLNGITR